MIIITDYNIERYQDYLNINALHSAKTIAPTHPEFTINITLKVSEDEVDQIQRNIRNNSLDFLITKDDNKLNKLNKLKDKLQEENKSLKRALKSIQQKYNE